MLWLQPGLSDEVQFRKVPSLIVQLHALELRGTKAVGIVIFFDKSDDASYLGEAARAGCAGISIFLVP
jgi:hypothetical protein